MDTPSQVKTKFLKYNESVRIQAKAIHGFKKLLERTLHGRPDVCLDRATLAIKWQSDEIKKYISGIDSEIEYTGGKVTINGKKDLEYGDEETKNSIQLSLVGLNAKGEDVQELDGKSIIKYVIRAKFDKEHVAAVPHTATVKFKNKDYTGEGVDLGNQYLYETTFTITVDQQDDKLFVFKRADAYFEGNDATAYGKVYANGVETETISYNLYSLYQANSILEGEELINSFVAFNEAIPEDEADEKEGKQWLESQGTSNGDISVEPSPAYGGAYMGRKITVTYAPFGNPRLNAIVDEFNLTIKSEIFEGNFEYAKKIDDKVIGTKDNPFEVDGGRSIDILESEFKKEDVYGATYKFDDDRIVKVEVGGDHGGHVMGVNAAANACEEGRNGEGKNLIIGDVDTGGRGRDIILAVMPLPSIL